VTLLNEAVQLPMESVGRARNISSIGPPGGLAPFVQRVRREHGAALAADPRRHPSPHRLAAADIGEGRSTGESTSGALQRRSSHIL
jgi:hypothetical protein